MNALSGNKVDPNLVVGNIKAGTTIFGVLGTYAGGSVPVLPSGNKFESRVYELLYDRSSPGPQAYNSLLCMYDSGTYVYRFHAWDPQPNSAYNNGYVVCIKVNKSTGAASSVTSPATSYGMTTSGTYYSSQPTTFNVNIGTNVIGLLRKQCGRDSTCAAVTKRAGLLTYDMTTDTFTDVYTNAYGVCGSLMYRGTYTFPGTSLNGGPTTASIMGTTMTTACRYVVGAGYATYNMISLELV